jgi:hypothetical protein
MMARPQNPNMVRSSCWLSNDHSPVLTNPTPSRLHRRQSVPRARDMVLVDQKPLRLPAINRNHSTPNKGVNIHYPHRPHPQAHLA